MPRNIKGDAVVGYQWTSKVQIAGATVSSNSISISHDHFRREILTNFEA